MPSATRVNLERLLRCCERLSGELDGRAERRRFETYLSVLEQYWHELKSQRLCGDDLLGEYRRKIERLAELLDEGKLLSGSGSALALAQAACNPSLNRSQANAELSNRLREKERLQQALRDQLNLRVAPPALASAGAPGAGVSAVRGAQSRLEAEAFAQDVKSQREQHDSLIEDIAHSVGSLRDRSRMMRQAVQDDNSTLESMDDAVGANRSVLDANNKKLKAQIQSTRSSSCWILLLLMVVAFMFFGTALFMKMVPKKLPRPPPTAS